MTHSGHSDDIFALRALQASGGVIVVDAGGRRCTASWRRVTGVLKGVGKATDYMICEVSYFATYSVERSPHGVLQELLDDRQYPRVDCQRAEPPRAATARPVICEAPAMSIEITRWLRSLRLEQYADAFLKNDIDGEILPKLTADDLIGLGVTSIGHRRKLLAAIATLRDNGSSTANARILSTEADGQDGGPVIPRQLCRASTAHYHVLRFGRFDSADLSP